MIGEDCLMLRKPGKIYDETDVEIVRLKGMTGVNYFSPLPLVNEDRDGE